ncbi:MAG: YgjV family protein [Clostridia bacterium]|nr:YgjV family protein [Clostridia bacterium]
MVMLWCGLNKVKRETIMLCNAVINGLWGIHFLLLGAVTGAFCGMVCVAMVLTFIFKGKVKLLSSNWVPMVFILIYIITGIVTWQNAFSLIAIAANSLLVIALWLSKEISIKFTCIFVGILMLIYNMLFFSLIGVIGQAISMSANITYTVKHFDELKKVLKIEK